MQIQIPYKPRPLQLTLHQNNARFKVLVCHRRFGKTLYAIADLQKKILTCKLPNPRGMYCAPFLKQARSIAWDYLCEFSAEIPGVEIHKGNLSVDYPNGGRITLAGADNIDAHRGIYLDHVVLDEYAQMSPRIWGEVFRPALSDRLGSAVFIGTPKGRGNNFYDVYKRSFDLPDWSNSLITVDDSNLISEQELESARLEMSEDEYAQEFMCSWDASLKGAYWAKELSQCNKDGRITKVSYQEELPVFTACDLGISDAFAVWFFQFVGNEVHFINHKEYVGMGLPEIFREMNKLHYNYGDHVAPHDIQVRELGTGMSRLEVSRKLGVRYKICKNIGVQDGIDAVRMLLKRAWFDSDRCAYGLECLRAYQSEWDDKKRIQSDSPLHNWASHSADAMRYVAVHFGSGRQRTLFDSNEQLDYSRRDRMVV